MDDEEEHGIVEDAPDENAEKETRAAEGGNLDDEGEQEVKAEEQELKAAEEPTP
jgi:hypothetical protein